MAYGQSSRHEKKPAMLYAIEYIAYVEPGSVIRISECIAGLMGIPG